MKKKIIIACIVLFVIIAIIAIILLVRKNKNQKALFEESDYPITYEQKEANIIVNLNGEKTKTLTWTVEIADDSYIDVKLDGKEKKGKATYIISPKKTGLTSVEFTRKDTVSDYEYEAVNIKLPIFVSETEKGLVVNLLENPILTPGPVLVAGETNSPFLISTGDTGAGQITFLEFPHDWVIEDPNNLVITDTYIGNDGESFTYLFKNPIYNTEDASSTDAQNATYNDASAGDALLTPDDFGTYHTTLTVSSASLGVTKYINVSAGYGNLILLEEGEKPKK